MAAKRASASAVGNASTRAASPRVLTVDPSGALARVTRALSEWTRPFVQIDVPTANDAWQELEYATADAPLRLLVTAFSLDDADGVGLAAAALERDPDLAVLIVAGIDAPEIPENALPKSARVVLMRRPLDGGAFLRAFNAALEGGSLREAISPATTVPTSSSIDADVPPIDARAARTVLDQLLVESHARTILLANRLGSVVLEIGAAGYLKRETLLAALLPTVTTTVEMNKIVGGRTFVMQMFDGDDYDVFVLSVGLHYMVCCVYDGLTGTRNLGSVSRYGRRAVEDLLMMLGASAFSINRPAPVALPEPIVEEEPEELLAVQSEIWDEAQAEADAAAEAASATPEPLRLEPIADFDMSIFNGRAMESFDPSALDDLFDPDKLALIADETRRDKGPLSYEEARELGIIP